MKHRLVILTTNFGTNFSGGALATCEVFSRIQDQFEKIIVLGSNIGLHEIKNLQFIKTSNWITNYQLIKNLQDGKTIFYGDFYNSFLLGLAKVPYVFTYHDNWPELARLNYKSFLQGFFFHTIYPFIFRKAIILITVSSFKKKYLEKYAKIVQVIPNGIRNNVAETLENTSVKKKILMVGNIDDRKYAMALKLFQILRNQELITIDIYGHILNKKLASKLKQFPFVNLKGFIKNVPFQSYKLLLHTSFTESFGLVFCEAIYNKVPVLAFHTGGAPEIITRENGRLVPAYKIEVMQEILLDMISNPIEVNSNTVESFTWERTSLNYKKIFQNVILPYCY